MVNPLKSRFKRVPAVGIRVSSEVGMRLPLLAGAGGKALLSLLSDSEIDAILSKNPLKRFTPNTIVDPHKYKKAILDVRRTGIAEDREEYIEGIVALSVPINTQSKDMQAAIWAAGLRAQVSEEDFARLSEVLREVTVEVNARLFPV